MKQISLSTIVLFIIFLSTNAQGQWINHSKFDRSINDLHVFDNELYLCGNFRERENNECVYFTNYDGNSFDDIAPNLGGSGLQRMATFQDELYATGILQIPNTDIYKWSGTDWMSPFGAGGHNYISLYSDEEEIYAGAWNGTLSKKTSNSFFYEIYDFEMPWDGIYAMNKYDGNLIVGGWIESWNVNNIAIWKSDCILPLGEGVSGIVNCMAVFQSELYVGGDFEMAGGKNAKFIAKWNGTNWSDVGGSVTGIGGGIQDMIVYNDKLYVVGGFNEIGGVAANDVAMWDGNNWNSLELSDEYFMANCVEIFENQLYIGVSMEDDESFLLSRDLILTNTKTIEKDQTIDLYPNPAENFIQVSMDEIVETVHVEIFNSEGKLMLIEESVSSDFRIDCFDWTAALYIMVFRNSKTQEVIESKRFFKL